MLTLSVPELRFTPEDILVKRDIDFINKVKYPDKYKEVNKCWKDFTREEKADFVMRYVDEITLKKLQLHSSSVKTLLIYACLILSNFSFCSLSSFSNCSLGFSIFCLRMSTSKEK